MALWGSWWEEETAKESGEGLVEWLAFWMEGVKEEACEEDD